MGGPLAGFAAGQGSSVFPADVRIYVASSSRGSVKFSHLADPKAVVVIPDGSERLVVVIGGHGLDGLVSASPA
jgi:hypothetical protein